MLKDLIITECNLERRDNVDAIVETRACPPQRNDRNAIQLLGVDFIRNKNLGGSIGLVVNQPSCYTVSMRDVLFRSNIYAKGNQMSSLNTVENIRLVRNRLWRNARRPEPQFYFPESSNAIVHNMSAEGGSGTVLKVTHGAIDIQNSKFLRNAAKESVVIASASTVLISSSRFFSNTCEENGAAVSLFERSFAHFSSVDFELNSALSGGAVYLDSAFDILMTRCSFLGNTAADEGGALRILEEGHVVISQSIFEGNRAASGGALSLARVGMETTISNSTFIGNSAEISGGALHLFGSETEVNQDCLFEDNRASFHGGALYMIAMEETDRIYLRDSIFKRNRAHLGGRVSLSIHQFALWNGRWCILSD